MIHTLVENFIYRGKLIPIDRKEQFIKDQNNIIYEVIRIIDFKPLFLDDHLTRFLGSFKLDKEKQKVLKLLLTKYLQKLIEGNNLTNGNIRFQFNSNQLNRFCAWFVPSYYPTPEQYNNGVYVNTYYGERTDPNIKSRDINLRSKLDGVIAQNNVYESILTNTKGEITEGSRSNIFFITDEQIVTPPFEMVLPGITRQKIIELIKKYELRFSERTILIDEISGFTSCFISGTSPKILPIKKFDEHSMDVKNPLLQKLIQWYDQSISDYLLHFKWN